MALRPPRPRPASAADACGTLGSDPAVGSLPGASIAKAGRRVRNPRVGSTLQAATSAPSTANTANSKPLRILTFLALSEGRPRIPGSRCGVRPGLRRRCNPVSSRSRQLARGNCPEIGWLAATLGEARFCPGVQKSSPQMPGIRAAPARRLGSSTPQHSVYRKYRKFQAPGNTRLFDCRETDGPNLRKGRLEAANTVVQRCSIQSSRSGRHRHEHAWP